MKTQLTLSTSRYIIPDALTFPKKQVALVKIPVAGGGSFLSTIAYNSTLAPANNPVYRRNKFDNVVGRGHKFWLARVHGFLSGMMGQGQ